MSSNGKSSDNVNGGDGGGSADNLVDKLWIDLSKANFNKLKEMRDNFDWETNHPVKFISQAHSLIRDWQGVYPNLRDIFRPAEIDALLKDTIIYMLVDATDNPGEVFMDFVIYCGYKDEPETDDDGKVEWRRATPIHHAAADEDGVAVRKLFNIYDRFDVNFVDGFGKTHFHVACEFGCDDVVQRFLQHGVDPNFVGRQSRCDDYDDDDNDPPLHLALANHHDTVVRLLLDNGANPNIKNSEGSTPLHVICNRNQGAIDRDNEYANTYFQLNEGRRWHVQINAQDKWGNTPLHLALKYGLSVTAEILLRRGADPNFPNLRGQTPLHFVCKKKDLDMVDLFFQINREMNQPLMVDVVDKWGWTPLQLAVANFSPRVVELLLDLGADLAKFVFPAERDFDEGYRVPTIDPLRSFEFTMTMSGALAAVELLEKRGYKLDRVEAMTVLKIFAKHEAFEVSSWDPKVLKSDQEDFAATAKIAKICPDFTLYEFIQLEPAEATKMLAYMDYFEFARINYNNFIDTRPKESYTLRLCEIMSRRFFQRWALDPLWSLARGRLPLLCCDMIVGNLMNRDLYNICLADEGRNSLLR